MPEGLAVSKAIREHLKRTPDTNDVLPVWVRFMNIAAAEVYVLQPYFCPSDKAFLSELVLAVEAVKKHTSVASFDYHARQHPKKHRATPVSPPLKSAARNDECMLDPYRLPLDLRFIACEEGRAEARQLGELYSRWPFIGFEKADLEDWSEKLASEFAERYPYLAQADVVLGGRLTRVIRELGRHPHQPAFELRRMWISMQKFSVMTWSELADELLAVIATGQGDRYRWLEENVETPAEKHLYTDSCARSRRPIAVPPIAIHCPPSVSDELWQQVPKDRQREAVEYAARGLRRGVHPEESMEDFLSGIAIAEN